jgi:hypothetical protein
MKVDTPPPFINYKGYESNCTHYLNPGHAANPLHPCFLSLQSVFLQGMFASSPLDFRLMVFFFFIVFFAN